MEKQKLDLYHGSDHIVETLQYGVGKPDNDYGSGFYTTRVTERAEEWALLYGRSAAVVNHYQIDLDSLKVLFLDDYGPLAWIAEVISNRGVSSAIAREFAGELIRRYKVDTSDADVIVGYRADDSYGEVIAAFMNGEITVEEVRKLFYRGELGEQYFIRSQEAFQKLSFIDSWQPLVRSDAGKDISEARREVISFLHNRRLQIAKRYIIPEISVADAIANDYIYRKEYGYYEKR